MATSTCTADACSHRSRRRGLCDKHSYRLYKHGDPNTTRYITSSVEDRLEYYIDTSAGPGACHPWTRGTNAYGYGRVRADGTQQLVPRVVMSILLGRPLLTSEWVLHTCDNPPCCNPEHLYLGDPKQNAKDRTDRKRHWRDRTPPRTHCKRGHAFTPENTLHVKSGRSCRTCRRVSTRKWYKRSKAKKAVR